ncbi:MAG: bifunctional demethylmenaquinone methyltransferase/2-methoxy-6-polyprenyl-1,4-benzoquinol methylase UbiE [Ectothiorhodospiraceae bacterium]|nr:bifunctional demethylmenaquinone methyltransferase/2-methoxy-6-polyprenyl-1,4-benzoquinol methylase UbiE [Chromatiales bacterium]MCP5155018.1 bifunctional demethylmenaquinone methyltransferase/2-methoxy-6-polyprenyl-1,4-benzoquinol methylase UbiE [Ectothiorhodospiraceae bacterium]
MSEDESTAAFGYREVPTGEKARLVREVFDSVAGRYDVMNDLMSLGIHRVWKRFAVGVCAPRRGERVLDLAGGTGDLARLLLPRVLPGGEVVLADVNAAMLGRGRDRLLDEGHLEGLRITQVDAEQLPFPDRTFDCVCIAFGLRNVTRKERALAEMHRVLRPGGRAMVLEFSRVTVAALRPLYDLYSFRVLPRLGQLVAGDAESYRYLAESIRVHPDQDTLREMMRAAGFERCDYLNLSAGIAAVHRGWRL